MKKNDIVKFKVEVDSGDSAVRMIVLEDPDGERVLVGDSHIINKDGSTKLAVKATCRYNVSDLEVCE